jgi:glutathione S-transferase
MMTIHGVPLSVHTRKTIVTALLKGIAHRVEPVIPFTPPANWDALSPTGLIPVMQDGDLTLPDSTAICLYMERTAASPAILPPDAAGYARALWLDAYAGGTIFRHVLHGLFFQKIIRPLILKQPTDQAAIDAILATQQPKVFRTLEAQLGGAFLVGDALSLADIAVVSNLINYQYLGFTIDHALYPRLAGYARRLVAHPVFQRALVTEEPFAKQMGLDRSFLAQAID